MIAIIICAIVAVMIIYSYKKAATADENDADF